MRLPLLLFFLRNVHLFCFYLSPVITPADPFTFVGETLRLYCNITDPSVRENSSSLSFMKGEMSHSLCFLSISSSLPLYLSLSILSLSLFSLSLSLSFSLPLSLSLSLCLSLFLSPTLSLYSLFSSVFLSALSLAICGTPPHYISFSFTN